MVYDTLIVGRKRTFSGDSPVIKLGMMYGIVNRKEGNDYLVVSNKIFEIRICNYFIVKDEENPSTQKITGILPYDVVQGGRFDMELCLRKFAEHYHEVFDPGNEDDAAFMERHGRMVFLTYLKPLINGRGFYHIESELTDLRRMDLVVDYGDEQFIIELKRWNGPVGRDKAYEQLVGYLEGKNRNTGYLLTFDFRKGRTSKAKWVELEGKRIFDVMV